jgi:hypothetical protein
MSPIPLRSMRKLATVGLLLVIGTLRAANPTTADFTGIWRLDDAQSDNAAVIEQRLRAERTAEQAPVVQPASASSTAGSGSGQSQHSRGGHGGGRGGMGGGGMGGGHGGHGGGDRGNKSASSDTGAAPNDPPPPLLDKDSLLNVQQDAKSLQVSLDNTDRLDTRLDGIARQSLNGNAVVQTRLTPDGLQISMQFDGGTRLQQDWIKSPDGHQLLVTERWSVPTVQQPIMFKRSYVRLDL